MGFLQISDVVFNGIEKPWSANIKRGVLNLIQVNLQRRNVVTTPEESRYLNEIRPETSTNNMDFFRVMEVSPLNNNGTGEREIFVGFYPSPSEACVRGL